MTALDEDITGSVQETAVPEAEAVTEQRFRKRNMTCGETRGLCRALTHRKPASEDENEEDVIGEGRWDLLRNCWIQPNVESIQRNSKLWVEQRFSYHCYLKKI